MRYNCISVLALLPLTALAGDTVTVTYTGFGLSSSSGVLTDGDGEQFSTGAGVMEITIDGEPHDAYCVDIDGVLVAGDTYEADLLPLAPEGEWCAINYIMGHYDPTTGSQAAAIQLAIWKILDPDLTTANASLEAASDAIVADATGACPMTCEADPAISAELTGASDGLLYGSVTVANENGVAVTDQVVVLSLTEGSLISPADGVGVTGDDGSVEVIIDPDGASSLGLDIAIGGQTLYLVDPLPDSFPNRDLQEVATFLYEECLFEAAIGWEAPGLGDMRTIGFWKHQAGVATGNNKGKAQVDAATLSGYLPLSVFDLEVNTLDALYAALDLKKASMQQRAEQQCLATMLNLESGQIGWQTSVDGTSFWELWADAEDAYYGGDFETAKTICDGLNNL